MIYYIELTFEQDPLSPTCIWSKNELVAIEYYKCTLQRYSKVSTIKIDFNITDDNNIDAFNQENELVLMTSSNNSVVVTTNGIYNKWLDCDFEFQRIKDTAQSNAFKLLTLLSRFCTSNDITDIIYLLANKIRKCDIYTLDYLCKFDSSYKYYTIK